MWEQLGGTKLPPLFLCAATKCFQYSVFRRMIGISQGTRLLPFADAVSLPGWVALCGPTKGPERRKMKTTKVETNNAAARVKKIISRAGSFLQCEWMNHLKLEWVCVCVYSRGTRPDAHPELARECLVINRFTFRETASQTCNFVVVVVVHHYQLLWLLLFGSLCVLQCFEFWLFVFTYP